MKRLNGNNLYFPRDFKLTSIIGPDSLVVAHLKTVEYSRNVDVSESVLITAESKLNINFPCLKLANMNSQRDTFVPCSTCNGLSPWLYRFFKEMTYLKLIKTVLFRVITRLVSEVQITQFRLKVDIYQFWRLGEKQ